jgi:hypothetical protein
MAQPAPASFTTPRYSTPGLMAMVAKGAEPGTNITPEAGF